MPIDPGISGWSAILPPGAQYLPLDKTITADWLVIGAGFAGLAAARRLRQLQPSSRIVLLEARRIAEGPVGRNSGFMLDLPHNVVSDDYVGTLEVDRLNTAMFRSAVDFAESAANEYGFSPETLVRSGKTIAAATNKGMQHNRDYAAHLDKLGETYELFDAAQMKALSGSNYYQSGLYTSGTAVLQPVLYAREMAAGLVSQGVTIFENSPVIETVHNEDVWTATTPLGSVQSPQVILAVNGHVESFGAFKKRLMHVYLYGSMTRALSDAEVKALGGERIWGFTPADPMGTTVRKVSGIGGTRIVVRNGMTWAPSRSVDEQKVTQIGKTHDKTFRARFPMLSAVNMEYRWGGLLCLSRNAVSAFGKIGQGLYSACCQNGLGATKGTLSGILIAEMASGETSDHLKAILSEDEPTRLPPEPFASIGAKAVMGWGQWKAGKEV